MSRRAAALLVVLLGAVDGCGGSSPTPPEGQGSGAGETLQVERFAAGRHRQTQGRGRYLPADADPGTWLEVARAPDRRAIAVALGDALELRATADERPAMFLSAKKMWRVEVSGEEPYGVQPTHPLLAFSRDGSRVAWLGGAGHGQRLIVVAVGSGEVEADVVFPALPQPGGGGGVIPPATPQVLVAGEGDSWIVSNAFAAYAIDVAALRMAEADRSLYGLPVNAAQDTGHAWDLSDGVLTRRGGGGRLKVECVMNERSVAIDEGLDRAAVLCARGGNPEGLPEVQLRRLSSGELLGTDVFPAAWGRLVIVDAETVLALSFGGHAYAALLSPDAMKDARHDPSRDAWVFMGAEETRGSVVEGAGS